MILVSFTLITSILLSVALLIVIKLSFNSCKCDTGEFLYAEVSILVNVILVSFILITSILQSVSLLIVIKLSFNSCKCHTGEFHHAEFQWNSTY